MTNNCQGFSARLEKILESDDETGFVKLLKDHTTDNEVTNSLVNQCAEFGAKKCLIALVRGKVCDVHPTFDPQIPDGGVTALAYVAHSCPDLYVLYLMLEKCGATCLVNVACTIGVVHGLPIHFVLINLSFMDHLFIWFRGQSLIKLVILLCLSETKPILDSARLLSQYTDSINDIAWTFLKNGGLKHFTALLLIAREKVIAPFDTGLTIYQYITSEIDSVTEGKLSIEQEEYKCMLMDARNLLAVFEVAGDDLSSYCFSMHRYVYIGGVVPVEDVVSDICGLLVKNKIIITDVDVSLYDCFREYRGLSSSRMRELMEPCQCNWLTAYPAKSSAHNYSISNNVDGLIRRTVRSTSMPMPKLACLASQPRLYSTKSLCQARMISKSLQHPLVCPLPRHLAYITMKSLTRFRFLF